jgi:hypothetical protein
MKLKEEEKKEKSRKIKSLVFFFTRLSIFLFFLFIHCSFIEHSQAVKETACSCKYIIVFASAISH